MFTGIVTAMGRIASLSEILTENFGRAKKDLTDKKARQAKAAGAKP